MVFSVHHELMGKQKLHHFAMSKHGSMEERRATNVIFSIDINFWIVEKQLYYSNMPLMCSRD